MNLRHLFICFVTLPIISGCNVDQGGAENCSPRLGCINAKFIAAVAVKCSGQNGKGCRQSLKSMVGSFDKVYFVERFGARLDECTTISIPDALKRSYTPLCQYVLFEKNGEVTSYLRGFCTSEIKIPKDEIGFGSANMGFVSMMDASKSIVIKKISDKNMHGEQKNFYQIEPQSSELIKLDPRKEKCVSLDRKGDRF